MSVVWSYRRDDTVDMAVGRAARMGAVLGGTGALLGLAVDRRHRRRTPAPRRVAGLVVPAAPALDQALEALAQAAEAARPRIEQAAEAARPRLEHAVEAARPRIELAAEAARPMVVHAVERAAKARRSRARRAVASG